MLGIMVNCLHGGPKFLTNMIPVAKLNTSPSSQSEHLIY